MSARGVAVRLKCSGDCGKECSLAMSPYRGRKMLKLEGPSGWAVALGQSSTQSSLLLVFCEACMGHGGKGSGPL